MSILDRVVKASQKEAFIKAFLYGRSGSGKSTICGTAPRPILFAYNELPSLRAFRTFAQDEATIEIKSMQDLRSLLLALREDKHDFKTICLDSLTEMQQLLIDELMAEKEKNKTEEGPIELGWKDRGYIHDKSRNFIRAFRSLPMHVIMTCLSEIQITKDKKGNVVSQRTRVMLSGQKLPEMIASFFNVVGYCFKIPGEKVPQHMVRFDGRKDLDTKGLPGLRLLEEPDIEYWYERAFNGAEPRDPEAPMILKPSRRWDNTDQKSQDTSTVKREGVKNGRKSKSGR